VLCNLWVHIQTLGFPESVFSMYMMVKIDFAVFPQYKDDVEFAKGLLAEEAVMVLPGTVFRADGFVRIVTAKGEEKLTEAMNRFVSFCERNAKKE
jgi:aspartate/methionine/tyrosine aminotransferase